MGYHQELKRAQEGATHPETAEMARRTPPPPQAPQGLEAAFLPSPPEPGGAAGVTGPAAAGTACDKDQSSD